MNLGNSFISDGGVQPYESRINVTVNKAGANATCEFVDVSGIYEANAEVGKTEVCALVTAEGVWRNGQGTVTGANNGDPTVTGGNAMLRCQFKAADFTPNP